MDFRRFVAVAAAADAGRGDGTPMGRALSQPTAAAASNSPTTSLSSIQEVWVPESRWEHGGRCGCSGRECEVPGWRRCVRWER